MPPALEHPISGQGGSWIQQPPSTSLLEFPQLKLYRREKQGRSLDEHRRRDGERFGGKHWEVPVPSKHIRAEGRCHLQAADGSTPLCRTRARPGWTGSGGAPSAQAGHCPGEAGRAQRQPGGSAEGQASRGTGGEVQIHGTHASCTPGGHRRAFVPPAGRQPWAGNRGIHVAVGLLLRFKMQRLVAWLAFCLQVQMGRRLTFSFSVWLLHIESCKGNPRRDKGEREEDFPVSTFIRFTLSLHYKVQRVSNITSTGPCKWQRRERALARINLSMYRCSLLTLLFSLGGYCGKTPV